MTTAAASTLVRPLLPDPEVRARLADILVETVAAGGSVSFMHPLSRPAAEAFWDRSLEAAARGGRIVFGAYDGGVLAATVTLLLDLPENQPHRAEIAKMMTAVAHRGRGLATALMRAAEAAAAERGRTLLVLDTAVDDGASGFYERLGWIRAGEIPDFALKPHGGLTGTILYYRRLGRPG